jgi:membrane-associated protease RseP (regulator of RpoE activity)
MGDNTEMGTLAAERAGLKPVDLVTELDGTPVRDAADLQLRLALLRIGEVAVSRDGGFRSSAWVFRSSASPPASNRLDEVTLRNYWPVGRRKGNMSLSDPLAAGVSLTFINPASVVFGYGFPGVV